MIIDSEGNAQKVNRAAPNAPSVIYDGVVVLGGDSAVALSKSRLAIHFVNEAFRHGKPIAFLADGNLRMKACKLPKVGVESGVIVGHDGAITAFLHALHLHRFARRVIDGVPG